jgi:hypothetical protein
VAAAAFFLRRKIRAVFGLRRKREDYVPLGEEKDEPRKVA